MLHALYRLYLRWFPLPKPAVFAQEELSQALLDALEEQTMAEYTAAKAECHQVMTNYHNNRIERLQAFLAAIEPAKEPSHG